MLHEDTSRESWQCVPEVLPCSLPLKTLVLESCNVTGKIMVDLVQKFGPTLRTLSLLGTHLCLRKAKRLIEGFEVPDDTLMWQDIIRSLAEQADHLSTFRLCRPKICSNLANSRSCHAVLFFQTNPFPGDWFSFSGYRGISYSGMRMRGFLYDLPLRLIEDT